MHARGPRLPAVGRQHPKHYIHAIIGILYYTFCRTAKIMLLGKSNLGYHSKKYEEREIISRLLTEFCIASCFAIDVNVWTVRNRTESTRADDRTGH